MLAHLGHAEHGGQNGAAIDASRDINGALTSFPERRGEHDSLRSLRHLSHQLVLLILNHDGPASHISDTSINILTILSLPHSEVISNAHRLHLTHLANIHNRLISSLDILPAMSAHSLRSNLEASELPTARGYIAHTLPLAAGNVVPVPLVRRAERVESVIRVLPRVMRNHDAAPIVRVEDAVVLTRHVRRLEDVALRTVEVHTRQADARVARLRRQGGLRISHGELHHEVRVVRQTLHLGRHVERLRRMCRCESGRVAKGVTLLVLRAPSGVRLFKCERALVCIQAVLRLPQVLFCVPAVSPKKHKSDAGAAKKYLETEHVMPCPDE